MKHIATVPAALVKAALHFQAKQDVRFYLNGVYITHDHILATNGHTLFVAPYESDLRPEEAIIVAIKGKIPPKAYNLELLFDDESKIGVMRCVEPTPLSIRIRHSGSNEFVEEEPKPLPIMDAQGHPQSVFFHIVEGKFPDWKRVLPTGDPEPTAKIGINFCYAELIAKACKELGNKYPACAVNLYGPNKSIEVELLSHQYPGAKAIIMPVRL